MGKDISQLHPRLQQKISQLKALCSKEGLILGIGECFRSVEEQDELYAQGRTKPGEIITNALGSTYSSQHQWGIAFDFYKNVSGHAFDDTAFFKRVGALGKSIGLGWGGDWKSPVDMPHLYLPDWGSTPSKLKQEYGNFPAFKARWSIESSQGNSSSSNSNQSGGAYMFTPERIHLGSQGNSVLLVQEILKARGIYQGELDKSFGAETEAAVITYQQQRKEAVGEADGWVGPKTWQDLIAI